jgi:general secretion pathway protein F
VPTFDYRADDAQGRRCKGRLEADSPRHARQLMRERGLWPRELHEVSTGGAAGTQPRSGHLSAADLALLTLQLSTLVQAGLPLEEALEAVTKQTGRRKVAGLLSAVRSRVMEGHALSTALG